MFSFISYLQAQPSTVSGISKYINFAMCEMKHNNKNPQNSENICIKHFDSCKLHIVQPLPILCEKMYFCVRLAVWNLQW